MIVDLEPEEVPDFLQALTHTSWANEHGGREMSNERLEFLGDAVLGYVIAEYLFNRYPQQPEGDLTRLKSELVREPVLAEIARNLEIPVLLRLGQGARAENLENRPSVQADAVEAIIGWIAANRGLAEAKEWILQHWENYLRKIEPEFNTDYKGMLQAVVQKEYGEIPTYQVVSSWGPDHAKRFLVQVVFADRVWAQSEGRSKKQAEQRAAKKALQKLG
ncbi:MAG: ribonuclease III [Firmicutes bacterium]|nr:ribonuclease III [Bacillota bacterium]